MSALEDWFEDVWDAVVAKIKTITEIGNDRVFYGKKFPVTAFPAAYVQPAEANSVPKTFTETEWSPLFNIYVVVENSDAKIGTMAVWKLCWKIAAALQADRTLGGLLHNLECGPLLDSPEGLGRGIEQHWVLVAVRCSKKML